MATFGIGAFSPIYEKIYDKKYTLLKEYDYYEDDTMINDVGYDFDTSPSRIFRSYNLEYKYNQTILKMTLHSSDYTGPVITISYGRRSW